MRPGTEGAIYMLMTRLVAGAATAVIAMSMGVSAYAQSTASQTQEVIVTGARTAKSTNGLAVVVNEAKDQSIVTKEFFETQSGSMNVDQLINLLPGVNYSSEDPTGITSGDLRIHGFDGAHVAIIVDGAPLNDTGNYASYPGEYVVSEMIDHISVNMGATDVDSPTASAVGGTVNIVTRVPPKEFGGQLKLTGGSYGYNRVYGEVDSGTVGPFGTTAYIGGEYVEADKWRGAGDLERWDVDGRIYQPLKGSDFISLAGNWTSERPIFYYSGSRANFAQYGYNYDYNPTWQVPTAVAGKADAVATPAYAPYGNDTGYFALHPNPVDFATLRGQSKFSLGHGLTFTFDPNFFYTIANGGGATAISESDKRLIGNATSFPTCKVGTVTKGVDLNGDGDCMDSVALYSPSNTQTFRYGLTSSLLWDLNPQNHFQLSYTLDDGHHRQTGEYAYINQANGQPADVFGARPGYATQVATADATTFRKRDRYSVAKLNQVAFNYIGKFWDDKIHIDLGGRAAYFERDLHQLCYEYNGSTEYCDTIAIPTGSTLAQTAALLGISPTTSPTTGLLNLRAPFTQTIKYHKFLPNAGISFRPWDDHLFYFGYAQGFSAPKTDDLYTSSPETVQPESSTTYSAGYRYQHRQVNASLNFYRTDYKNRIVQSYDPNDPTLSVDRNIGDVTIQGVDFEVGITPIEHLNIYASADYTDSEVKSNYFLATGGVSFALPTAGKELVMTPDHTYSLFASYDFGPITIGGSGKYQSSRWISDVNDDRIPGFATFDFNARYKLPYFNGKSYFQLNVTNLFNRFYISRSSTVSNAYNYVIPTSGKTYTPSTPFMYVGAPSMFQLTFNAKF
jgi:iron complex outermembrane receptor protein